MWQNILTNWVGDAIKWLLVAVVGGTVLAWLKARKPQWGPPAMFGLGASALIFAIGLMFIGWRAIPGVPDERTSTENVDQQIQKWALNYGFSLKRQATPDAYFSYEVVLLGNNHAIYIRRTKARPYDLSLVMGLRLDEEQKKLLPKLSKDRQSIIEGELEIELARHGVGFVNAVVPFNDIQISKALPITDTLTDATFLAGVNDLDDTVIAAGATLRIGFLR